MLRRWWTERRPLGSVYAWTNVVIGAVFLLVAALGWDLGLGTYARWLFALPFGLVPLGCGLLALRFGDDPVRARQIRVGGDIGLWAPLVVLTVLALALDDAEFGPLFTLLAFLVVTLGGAFLNARKRAG